jgi:hypothetical protein
VKLRSTARFIALAFLALLSFVFASATKKSGIPNEVRHKSGYVNSDPKPPSFTSAMLWGIAIADTRAGGYEAAQIEIARVRLSCRADGKDVVLNDDSGNVAGGLYRRYPWFGTDTHDPIPLAYSADAISCKGNESIHGEPRLWSSAWAVVRIASGTSGRRLLGQLFRLVISKAVPPRPVSASRRGRCCKSALIIGAHDSGLGIRQQQPRSPAPAIGTFHHNSGKKPRLLIAPSPDYHFFLCVSVSPWCKRFSIQPVK